MYYKDVIQLIKFESRRDEIGETIMTEIPRTVAADKKSVKQSEFYQAQAVNLRPDITFIIHCMDYEGETRVEYNGRQFDIIRTFTRDDERVELVCQGVANGTT